MKSRIVMTVGRTDRTRAKFGSPNAKNKEAMISGIMYTNCSTKLPSVYCYGRVYAAKRRSQLRTSRQTRIS